MTSIVFAKDASLWKDNFGRIGGLRKWLLEDKRTPFVSGFDENVRPVTPSYQFADSVSRIELSMKKLSRGVVDMRRLCFGTEVWCRICVCKMSLVSRYYLSIRPSLM